MLEELGGKAGIRPEQQRRLAVHDACIQMRNRHGRRAYRGQAVDLGLMLLDDFRLVAAQPLTTDREATVALAFFDIGHLQQRQCCAASTEEDEAGLDFTIAAVTGVLDLYAPALAVASQAGDLLEVGHRHARLGRQILQHLPGQLTEVDVSAIHRAGRGDRLIQRTARHHQRHPLFHG